MQSIINFLHLVFTGSFEGPIFGLFEDATVFQPFYWLHQVDPLYLVLAVIVLVIMVPAILRSYK